MLKRNLLIFLLLISAFTFASIKIDNVSYDQISLSLDFPETRLIPATTDDYGTFSIISLPGATNAVVGNPNTPFFGNWILVPNGTKPILDVNYGDPVVTEKVRLIPSQPQTIDKVGARPQDFLYDKNIYNQNKFFPESLVITEIIKEKRGQDCTILWISPYQYNPVTETLKYYSDMQINVSFIGNCQPLPANLWDDLNIKELESFGINGREVVQHELTLAENYSETRDEGYNLLIITVESLLSSAEELANWKTKMGYKTKVVTTSQIGSTAVQIQAYIDNAYENLNPAPSYLLILGDAEHIPTWYVTTHPSTDYNQGMTGSDLYYADTSFPADLIADMGYARIPVNNLSEAESVISKIIEYESSPPEIESYYNTATCSAYFQDAGNGYAERRFAKTSEDIRNFLSENLYNVNRLYKTETSTYPLYWNNDYYIFENDTPGAPISEEIQKPQFPWDATYLDINNAINQGTFLLIHRDHGWRDGWGDPYYTSAYTSNLVNQYFPVVYSVNCETGWFDNETDQDNCNTSPTSESFVENFLRNPDGGAVGLIGATRISFSGNNDRLIWGLMDAIWPDFLQWCTADYPAHNPIYQMSDILNYGKEYMMANAIFEDELRTTTLEEFHWFGDPTMRIWTQQPQLLNVTHSPNIDLGDNSFEVNCDLEGAKASVIFNNEIIGQSYIFGGSANVSFDPISEMGTMEISVTKANHLPYISTIEIIPTGPYLVCHEPFYIENGSYNDEIIQSLDEIDMQITLENIGILPSEDQIQIVLTNSDNTVTMITDTLFVNSIAQTDSTTLTDMLHFVINPGLTDSSYIPLTVTINSSDDQWQYNFQLLVHAPEIQFNTYSFIVLDGGDQIIDPGETTQLTLNYHNTGSGWSYNLATTLYSSDPYISLSGMDIIPSIAPGTNGQTSQILQVIVSEECPIDYYMEISTMAMDDVGSFLNHTFAIPIGILEYNFDIGVTAWEHDPNADNFIDSWHISSQRNYTTDGQFALKCGSQNEDNYVHNIFAAVYSPEIQIGNNTHLRFHHWLETGVIVTGFAWDGGIVEISVDGGEFFQIEPEGGYPYDILNLPNFPFEPLTPVFAGSIEWEEADFDLSAYTGSIQIRFVFASSPTMYTMEGWYIDDIQIITVTDSENEEIIPLKTQLLDNYPNPFNPQTRIDFQLSENQKVELDVYNIKGQKIKSLVSDFLPAGNYNFLWKGNDDNGNKVSSGIYFYQMKTRDKTYCKKMLMLK